MSGTTRKIQQPASTGSLLIAIGMAIAVVAAVVAISWGSANLGKATQAAPAPLSAPAARDLGSRDEGAAAIGAGAADMIHDRGSSEAAAVVAGSTGYHGFGNRADRPTTNGSNGVVPARRNPAFLPR